MTKEKYSRRSFIRRNSIGFTGLFFSKDLLNSKLIEEFQSLETTKGGDYVVSSFFNKEEDISLDIFGDLNLIRKGASNMTMGSGETEIKPINSLEEWESKKENLRILYKSILGVRPNYLDYELSIKIESEVTHDNIIERRVSYQLSPEERVTSIMLIPKGKNYPLPSLLTIHPTTKYGKEQTVGRGDIVNGVLTPAAYNRAYGLHLAEMGYVTFSPDLLGAGERIFPGKGSFDNQPFINANPEWSGTGKDLWDMQRAIDVMETFPEVDSLRIGSIGHSQGAGLTGILSAMDERIKVGVANCGIWPLRISKNPFNAARTGWWTGLPALRPYLHLGKPIPVDSHELLALSAPRPFLIITALNDVGYKEEEESFTRFAWENLDYNVKKLYSLYDEEQKFKSILHSDGHDFTGKSRKEAYKFIEKYI